MAKHFDGRDIIIMIVNAAVAILLEVRKLLRIEGVGGSPTLVVI